jgi:hypothetical protein
MSETRTSSAIFSTLRLNRAVWFHKMAQHTMTPAKASAGGKKKDKLLFMA